VTQHADDRQITIDELLDTAKKVDALLITLNEKCRKDVIDRIPENIKCISTFSIGFDHIDLDACKGRGIKVGNAPHGVTVATAEIAMLLLLGSARRAGEGEHMIRTRSWPGWAPLQLVGQRLDGKTLGIYGFGKIGQALAKRARGFDMNIHYYDLYRQPVEKEKEMGVTYHDSLDSLLKVSQFFSINAPSTPETRYFFNKTTIEKLPHGAIVVNTARGDLVNDEDMIAALKSGRLGYAGLDVFAGEPKIHEAYYDLPNTFLFPHLGSAAIEARNQMGFEALDNIDAFFAAKDMPFKLA
jgi:lactate dehydrogenase-like 2-hydroxyacid dehydrogenase